MNAYTPSALQSATAHWALSGFCDEHLAREIAQARQDERSDLCALLAERVRRQERADPSLKVARLEAEAGRLDDKVAAQATLAEQKLANAIYSATHGRSEDAEAYAAQAKAAKAVGARLEVEAFSVRLQAILLKASLQQVEVR